MADFVAKAGFDLGAGCRAAFWQPIPAACSWLSGGVNASN